MPTEQELADILSAYDEIEHDLGIFMDGIRKWFDEHRRLRRNHSSIVHSVKSRLKDRDHLKDKISRKWDGDCPISSENVFEIITDLAGVRVLHLYQDQFPKIHVEILDKIHKSILRVEAMPSPDYVPVGPFTEPPKCVHDDFKQIPDVVEAYRQYYMRDKQHFCVWTKRPVPEWFV